MTPRDRPAPCTGSWPAADSRPPALCGSRLGPSLPPAAHAHAGLSPAARRHRRRPGSRRGARLLALARYATAAALGFFSSVVVFSSKLSPPDAALWISCFLRPHDRTLRGHPAPLPTFVLLLALLALNVIPRFPRSFPGGRRSLLGHRVPGRVRGLADGLGRFRVAGAPCICPLVAGLPSFRPPGWPCAS